MDNTEFAIFSPRYHILFLIPRSPRVTKEFKATLGEGIGPDGKMKLKGILRSNAIGPYFLGIVASIETRIIFFPLWF